MQIEKMKNLAQKCSGPIMKEIENTKRYIELLTQQGNMASLSIKKETLEMLTSFQKALEEIYALEGYARLSIPAILSLYKVYHTFCFLSGTQDFNFLTLNSDEFSLACMSCSQREDSLGYIINRLIELERERTASPEINEKSKERDEAIEKFHQEQHKLHNERQRVRQEELAKTQQLFNLQVKASAEKAAQAKNNVQPASSCCVIL